MTRRKSTPERKSRSGPIPESQRHTVQVKLRLPPAELARLDRLRADRGMDRSAYVVRLGRIADGVDPEMGERK